MSRYNLIDENWIPVRFLDENRRELGIQETLTRANEIAAIEDQSPLIVAALHRFLLAVLYRALNGPKDIEEAREMIISGISSEKVNMYLEKWRHRFWLFDDNNPFMQIQTFQPRIWKSWTVLAAEHNADNAKVLFDHIDVALPGIISEASAVRWILATQNFAVSCGKSELSHTGTAPSATAAMILPIGSNLQETLLYSLVPQNREILVSDLPVWERDPETVEDLQNGIQRIAFGYADRYTWRTRSIRLDSCSIGGIERLAFASGVGYTANDQIDPMHGYRVDQVKGKLPVQFRERGIWRDFDSLLPDDSRLAPQVIDHAIQLTRGEPKRFPRSVFAIGQSNNKAKIEFWRMERFVLPIALLEKPNIRSSIKQLLSDAEDAQKSLYASCSIFARELLSRGARVPASSDIHGFIQQMPIITYYWSTLESGFHQILSDFTIECNENEIRRRWLQSIYDTLDSAWEQHRISVGTCDAWTIRSLVKAERPYLKKLNELRDNISQLIPTMEHT